MSDPTKINLDLEPRNTTLAQPKSMLKGKSADQKEHLKILKACQEFEEVFLRVILKEAKVGQSMTGGESASQLYSDLTRESLAKAMAEAGGIGLAETLFHQFSKDEKLIVEQKPIIDLEADRE